MIRHLVLEGSPAQLGEGHGSAHADEIRRYAEGRVQLSSDGGWAGHRISRDSAIALAEAMLPAHRRYAPDLCEEMEAMAAAAGLSAAEAVIGGGFTDFVDAVRARAGGAVEEDDCTAVIVPDRCAEGRGFLAQTWDMHDTATEHVVMLDIRPAGKPRALVFSTVGCLGQIGLNEAGVAVGINNLTARTGRVGVTWPFVVRKALQQQDADAALDCVLEAELAGAHNYLIFDASGRGYNVEAMPRSREVTKLEEAPLVHTNHCLHAETEREQADKSPLLRESSRKRLQRAEELLSELDVATPEWGMAFTRDPVAICQRSKPPFRIESSGAALMRPATGEMWACQGLPTENEFERFHFES